MEEITLNRQSMTDLTNRDRNAYYGVTCGRWACRIGQGKFTIGESEYQLPINENRNSLHGGIKGWDRFEWDAQIINDKNLSEYTDIPAGMEDQTGFCGIAFTRRSEDMEQEYPGQVDASSIYLVNA